MNRAMLNELLGTEMPEMTEIPARKHRSVVSWVDFVTLLAILSGATLLGLIALVGDPINPYLGLGSPIRIIYGFIGLSVIWQWVRQLASYSLSLLAVFCGAAFLGLLALAGDTITAYLGLGSPLRIIYGVIGLSALWQWSKQRF